MIQNSHISRFFGVSDIASLSGCFSPLPAIPGVSQLPIIRADFPVFSKARPFLRVVVDQVSS